MDNYLSHRWPQGALVTQRPEKARQKKKKRRVLRTLAVCLLLAALLVGLMAAGWFLAQKALEQWAADLGRPEQSAPAWPEPTQEETPELSIPRAEVGLGVTLELDETRLSALPAQEIYQQVLPSVVSVVTHMSSGQGYGAGSGVIMREDGYILTNYHVVENSNSITVAMYNGDTYDATLIGYDESNDVAVLKVDAQGLPPVVLGDSDNLNVGDSVVAIGNPLGELTFSLTAGLVSAKDREVTLSNSLTMDLIQTDCAINSGNSGGALFNLYGEVIGITNAKYSSSSSSSTASIDNIGFAIPINHVLSIVKSIIEKGYISKPYVGVSVSDVNQQTQLYGIPAGAAVQAVSDGSPAAEAGLQAGDVITRVNGTEITGSSDLVSLVSASSIGDTLTMTVYRQGSTMELTVTVGEQVQSALANEQTQQAASGSQSGGWNGYPFGGRR